MRFLWSFFSNQPGSALFLYPACDFLCFVLFFFLIEETVFCFSLMNSLIRSSLASYKRHGGSAKKRSVYIYINSSGGCYHNLHIVLSICGSVVAECRYLMSLAPSVGALCFMEQLAGHICGECGDLYSEKQSSLVRALLTSR